MAEKTDRKSKAYKAIGEKIKTYRLSKGLTQKALADRCGMKDSAIRKYESGTIIPKYDTLTRIANGLKIPVYELVDLDRNNVEQVIASRHSDEDRRYFEQLSEIALSLNAIGRDRLLEQARMLSKDARFIEKNPSKIAEMWGEDIASGYGISDNIAIDRHLRNVAGAFPEYDENREEE